MQLGMGHEHLLATPGDGQDVAFCSVRERARLARPEDLSGEAYPKRPLAFEASWGPVNGFARNAVLSLSTMPVSCSWPM